MIKTIIKRNKSREPFSPEKLNGWGEWASTKLGRYVNWPEVVLRTVSTLPAECTSETLQKTLIKVCIDKATWEYSLMAGKLYAALMMKDIHKGSYPSVMHLHGEMIADRIMVPLNYSKEDYDAIEKMIDHSRDYKSAHYELHQIRYKYSLRNKVTGKEYETPQFVYMRMAMALAEDEPIETRLTDVKAWYDHFSNKRINAPTPYYTNLGTTLNGYASCCLYSADDSWPSLLAGDVIAYSMTCMSAGIGSHIKTRSIGDSIRNGLIQHQGKIPYYRALVGMINANLQNGRGGAATMHYTAFDPEVEVISKLKNPMTPAAKQVRGIDYSFGSNKFFVRKVRNNEEVALFSVLDAPELYEAQYSKDPNEFERKYNEFLASDKPRIMVPARKIALNPLMEAFDTGRHYLHFTDLMNSHTPFIEPVRQSNLCVTGDTKIDIKCEDGTIVSTTMGDYVEQYEFGGYFGSKIKSFDEKTNSIVWSEVTAAAQTGISSELYEIENENGDIVRCTADHLIFTKNRGYVRAADLIETDVLCSEI